MGQPRQPAGYRPPSCHADVGAPRGGDEHRSANGAADHLALGPAQRHARTNTGNHPCSLSRQTRGGRGDRSHHTHCTDSGRRTEHIRRLAAGAIVPATACWRRSSHGLRISPCGGRSFTNWGSMRRTSCRPRERRRLVLRCSKPSPREDAREGHHHADHGAHGAFGQGLCPRCGCPRLLVVLLRSRPTRLGDPPSRNEPLRCQGLGSDQGACYVLRLHYVGRQTGRSPLTVTRCMMRRSPL